MILRRCAKFAAGTTALGFASTLVGAVSFSPSISSIVLRRRKLLGTSEIPSHTEPTFVERMAALRDSPSLLRFGSAAATVGLVAFDFWLLKRSKPKEDEHSNHGKRNSLQKDKYVQLKKDVNERSAQRMYQLCHSLGGV
jgi:hypothetical protein